MGHGTARAGFILLLILLSWTWPQRKGLAAQRELAQRLLGADRPAWPRRPALAAEPLVVVRRLGP